MSHEKQSRFPARFASRFQAQSPPLSQQVIVLGASNVALSLPAIVAAARDVLGGPDASSTLGDPRLPGTPLNFFIAGGHGRSYGVTSRVLARKLPGITECGLWEALRDQNKQLGGLEPSGLASYALITDIGNDILYGFSPKQIMCWVNRCIDRLVELGTQVVMTDLPLASVAKLSKTSYLIFRSLIFPSCRVSLNQARESAIQLSESLHELAAQLQIRLVGHDADWYGLDPIHIKRQLRLSAYRRWISDWLDDDVPNKDGKLKPLSRSQATRLRRMKPARRWMWGTEQLTEQPTGRFEDGSVFWMY